MPVPPERLPPVRLVTMSTTEGLIFSTISDVERTASTGVFVGLGDGTGVKVAVGTGGSGVGEGTGVKVAVGVGGNGVGVRVGVAVTTTSLIIT